MLCFADILRARWDDYVAGAPGPIPSRCWKAVEAVLSCRTERCGGHAYVCRRCRKAHYLFHSCNHRACPRCGGADQKAWAKKQEARLLPVPYWMVGVSVPEPVRALMLRYPKELCPIFFQETAGALRDLLGNPQSMGADPGFISVLHTWTRRMLFHPHLHILVPAVGLAPGGCALRFPEDGEFLLRQSSLAKRVRARFEARLRADHPELAARIDIGPHSKDWIAHCRKAGRGRRALRYLAAYVRKTAFCESRLAGYDEQGRVLLRWKDSSDNIWKTEAIDELELIRRWLLHVLPPGMPRTRYFGWMSAAAVRARRRLRFLLGLGPERLPLSEPVPPPDCPRCGRPLEFLAKVLPARGPPLSRTRTRRRAA